MKSLIAIILLLLSIGSNAQCGACRYQANLVTNGAFSSGNTGFTSDLEYVTGIFTCPLCPENTYTIGANAILYHSDFWGSDHTNPPNGNFFIANGQGQSGSNVWCQSFSVQPNTDYTFSFWAQDVNSNNDPHPFAQLQASLNGALSVDTLTANDGWVQFTLDWNSGVATWLDLCIVNQQWQTGGNDFGLDDISFTGCHDYHLSQTANAGADQTICSNEQIGLGEAPNAGYNYSWNNATGLSSTTVSNPVFSLENTSANSITEEYVLTLDSANVGCIQTDTVLITVLPMPPFALGNDTLVCPDDLVLLDAGLGWNNITWSNMQGGQTTEVGAGTYWVDVQYNTCTASDTVVISELAMPQISLGPDQSICSNQPLTLDAGYVGEWSTDEIAQSIVVDETGSYTFIYTNGPCTAMDEIVVTVFEYPLLMLPADTVFCEGTSITLNANETGLWNNGTTASAITVNEAGYYDIVVENGPCTAVAGTLVDMILLPVAALSEDTLVCDGEYVLLNAYAVQNDTYEWSTGDSIDHVSVSVQDNYSVIVTNECGSAQSETFVETYLCDWQIFIPNSFTPNDDEYNQTWAIQAYNVTNVKIFVYNRLGDLIFYTNDISKAWAPTAAVGDDVYNYRIEALTFDNEYITRLGHIYLLR